MFQMRHQAIHSNYACKLWSTCVAWKWLEFKMEHRATFFCRSCTFRDCKLTCTYLHYLHLSDWSVESRTCLARSVVNIVSHDTTYSPTVKLGSYVENQNANGGEKWSARHVNIQVLPHLLKLWVNGYSHSHGRGPGLRITWWRHNFSR